MVSSIKYYYFYHFIPLEDLEDHVILCEDRINHIYMQNNVEIYFNRVGKHSFPSGSANVRTRNHVDSFCRQASRDHTPP